MTLLKSCHHWTKIALKTWWKYNLCLFHVLFEEGHGLIISSHRSLIWCNFLSAHWSGDLSGHLSQALQIRQDSFAKFVSIALHHILFLLMHQLLPQLSVKMFLRYLDFHFFFWVSEIYTQVFMPKLKMHIKTGTWKCMYCKLHMCCVRKLVSLHNHRQP